MNVTTEQVVIINRVQLLDKDEEHQITVRDGHIESIRATSDISNESGPNVSLIDGTQQIAVPGLCDLYSRLREPGLTRKGSIASESQLALASGFTKILCSPDTQPPIDNIATVQLIRQRAEAAQGAEVLPVAALTAGLAGEQLSELATLQAAGCPAASQADVPLSNTNVLFSAMEYAASFSLPLFMTARDSQLGAGGCAHAGAVATRLGLPSIPVAAETVALARLLELCRETGCRLHISRISSARALQMIDAAKQAALPVTCDVALHHLFFTDDQLAGYDSSFHSEVPFRSIADRRALRDGLRAGTIDAICTDHAPHDRDASLAPFPATESGLSAYHWALPLILQLPNLVGLSLNRIFEKLSAAPQRIINGDTPPGLSEGTKADFFLLSEETVVEPMEVSLESVGTNHPLNIHTADELDLGPLLGRATHVFLQARHHEF